MTLLDARWHASAPAEHRRVLGTILDPSSDAMAAQLVRFAIVGGLSNVLYLIAFIGLDRDGSILANVIGSIASTAVANELHRRLTFHASQRVGWLSAQWEGGGLAVIGIVVSSAALASLNLLIPGTSGIAQASFVIGVSAAVGGMRFLALRGWVF